jgi:hypothetical protein
VSVSGRPNAFESSAPFGDVDVPRGHRRAEDVALDKRGILLTDYQSYERVIEGLKRAADGCLHRAAMNYPGSRDPWNRLTDKMAVRASGFNRLEDGKPTERKFGSRTLSLVEATTRISQEFKEAGCR